MRRFELALLIGLLVSLFLPPAAGFARDCQVTREGVARLHIMAASDSPADQADKLAVRDRLLAASDDIFAAVPGDARQAVEAARARLPLIEELANDELALRGSRHTATAQITRMYFETRVYGDYMLPAGVYDAVRVVIDGGEGQNWWCVMYPPLCLPAARPADDAQAAKTQEIAALDERPAYRMEFAVVELWERAAEAVREWTASSSSSEELP